VLDHPALKPARRQFVVIAVITVALAMAYGGITRPPFGPARSTMLCTP